MACITIVTPSKGKNARIPLQIDVGFGDVITPGPIELEYPTLFSFPAPKLRAYSKESVVAEKFEAMVKLGIANSRMKDFYDLCVMARQFEFEGQVFRQPSMQRLSGEQQPCLHQDRWRSPRSLVRPLPNKHSGRRFSEGVG